MNKLFIAMFAVVTFAQVNANTEELATIIKTQEIEVVAPSVEVVTEVVTAEVAA